MGSKIPGKGSNLISYKCPHCPRTLTTIPALKSHLIWIHKKNRLVVNSLKIKKGENDKPKSNTANVKKENKKKVLRIDKKPNDNEQDKSVDTKNAFDCSDCTEKFKTRGEMLNHMKIHAIEDSGILPKQQPDDSNPKIGKDSTIELTQSFNHITQNYDAYSKHVCAVCNAQFPILRLLIRHIESMHRQELLSFFFPTDHDFISFKVKTETDTNTNYSLKSTQEMRDFYFCTHHIEAEDETSLVQCSSRFVTRQFEKGIQVFFFKQHHCHEHKEFILDDEIKQFLIKIDTKQADENSPDEKQNLQKILKTSLYKIMRDCNYLAYDKLEKIYLKLQELDYYINHDNVKEPGTAKRKIVMSETVNETAQKRRKSVLNEPSTPVKGRSLVTRSQSVSFKEADDIKIVNTFTLADQAQSDIEIKAVKDLSIPVESDVKSSVVAKPRKRKSLNEGKRKTSGPSKLKVLTTEKLNQKYTLEQTKSDSLETTKVEESQIETKHEPTSPSTFVDSYKSFIEKTSINNNNISTPKTLQPKNAKSFYQNKEKSVQDTSIEQSEISDIPIKIGNENESSKTNVSDDNILTDNNKDLLVPIVKKKKIKKEKLKTKLGQFSPKKSFNVSNISPKDSYSLPNIKFKNYEVKERENDCNILILKF